MYSLYELMYHYSKHKNIIDAYLKGESVEYYSGDDELNFREWTEKLNFFY